MHLTWMKYVVEVAFSREFFSFKIKLIKFFGGFFFISSVAEELGLTDVDY